MVTLWLGTQATLEGGDMIIFEGDFIQLHDNFDGYNDAWLQVITVEPYDICILSNGAMVCASDHYISAVKSANEFINGQ